MRSGVVEQVADLGAERRNMSFKHENIALSMISDSIMYAIWRRSDNEIRLSKLSVGGKVTAADSIDLGELYKLLINR
jgi:hypothetical protein